MYNELALGALLGHHTISIFTAFCPSHLVLPTGFLLVDLFSNETIFMLNVD